MYMVEFDEQSPSPEEYSQLREIVGWGGYDPQSAAEGLAHSLYTASLREDGQLVAFGRVIGDGRITFYIQDVIVIPEKRGLGYARTIMDHLMAYITEAAVPNAVVGLMAADGVEALYEKYGFTRRPAGRLGAGMTLPSDWKD